MIETDWYHIEQIAHGLYGIGEPKHIEEVNSFLLISESESILIDTGMGFYSMKSAISAITSNPCQVLNTHSHFDHVGSNHEFPEIKLYDHPANRKAATNGFDSNYLSKWFSEDQFIEDSKPNLPNGYSIKPFASAEFFSDGDILGNATFKFEAIHTPGHSDDSVCFWDNSRGWLFSGDLLYDGPIFIEKNGGLTKFKNSVTKITELKGLSRIFSSHNYFEFSLEKLKLLQDSLDKISTLELEETINIEGRLRLVPD